MTGPATEHTALQAVKELSPDEKFALLIVLRRHQAGQCTLDEALSEFRDWAETQRSA